MKQQMYGRFLMHVRFVCLNCYFVYDEQKNNTSKKSTSKKIVKS